MLYKKKHISSSCRPRDREVGCRGGDAWGREREVNPFGNDDVDADAEPAFEQENPVFSSTLLRVNTFGDNVPPPVNTLAENSLGEAPHFHIRGCFYVKPTPFFPVE